MITFPQSPARLSAQIVVTGGRSAVKGILAVWEDGFILWSTDSVGGGAPYFYSWREPSEVRSVATGILRWAATRDWPLRKIHTGPSSRFSALTLYEGGEPRLHMATWHELLETNPDLVVTAGGVEPLAGRVRADVLAAQPETYLVFRRRWQAVKGDLLALVPAEGAPYDPGSQRTPPWQQSHL